MSVADDLTRVTEQERELRLLHFDEEAAWELGTRLRDMAQARRLAIVIEVRRFNQPLFYTALKGTTPDNPEWVRRKGNVVARYHRSSYGVGLDLQLKGQTLEERGHPIADFAAYGGSFPIHLEDAGVIGSVTVSGLPQRDDHELVVEALCALLGREYHSLRLEPGEV